MQIKAGNETISIPLGEAGNIERGEQITLTAKLKAEGVPFPNSDSKDNTTHNQYAITVSNGTKKKRFHFYDSQANFEKGIKELDGKALLFAFRAVLGDGQAGRETFNEFCGSFGYGEDSKKAERLYKECVKARAKLENLGITESIASDILEGLSKQGIE